MGCAQVDKPWPVDVMDHQGVWHSIPLVPGEMALYEGASCPHGRPVRGLGPRLGHDRELPSGASDSLFVPISREWATAQQLVGKRHSNRLQTAACLPINHLVTPRLRLRSPTTCSAAHGGGSCECALLSTTLVST